MHGGLLVVKPPGMTSHDAVEYVRELWDVKVGHTGTLDPAAAGLLVLCIGAATRLSEYLLNCNKTYRAEITFGLTTTTADVEGEITQQQQAGHLTAIQVEDAISSLTGSLEMTVPAYSAVSQDGTRLYEYAAREEKVTLPTRQVQVYHWELLDFIPGQHPAALTEVECSKGTYVRSLAEMLGERLKTGAYLSFLVRTRIGPHCLKDASTLEEIKASADNPKEILLPPLQIVPHLPAVEVDQALADQLRQGNAITLPAATEHQDPTAVTTNDGSLLCIAEATVRHGQPCLQPRKVFDWST